MEFIEKEVEVPIKIISVVPNSKKDDIEVKTETLYNERVLYYKVNNKTVVIINDNKITK